MIPRPDIDNACESCGCAVEAGETECRSCAAFAVLAALNAASQRALREIQA